MQYCTILPVERSVSQMKGIVTKPIQTEYLLKSLNNWMNENRAILTPKFINTFLTWHAYCIAFPNPEDPRQSTWQGKLEEEFTAYHEIYKKIFKSFHDEKLSLLNEKEEEELFYKAFYDWAQKNDLLSDCRGRTINEKYAKCVKEDSKS